MPPEELEQNYVGLVEGGAYTWQSLRATAEADGWAAVVAICDKYDPQTETATRQPAENAALKPPAKRKA